MKFLKMMNLLNYKKKMTLQLLKKTQLFQNMLKKKYLKKNKKILKEKDQQQQQMMMNQMKLFLILIMEVEYMHGYCLKKVKEEKKKIYFQSQVLEEFIN